MGRKPEIGNVQLYPDRRLSATDQQGYYLRFYCPLQARRVRRYCGTRDRRQARRVLRECCQRLLNGEYIASAGAITAAEAATRRPRRPTVPGVEPAMTWSEASERYRRQLRRRSRKKSVADTTSRLAIAERILQKLFSGEEGNPVSLAHVATLNSLEMLQEALLDGHECRYESRSPNTVNSMTATVLAFLRYCCDHEWIAKVPPLHKVDVDEVMKGRPITGEEFDRMLEATSRVVGEGAAASWQFTLRVLWESTLRIQDVMDFSWDDPNYILPVWPRRKGQHPTIMIPPAQKNGKHQEIPMLPGLAQLLESVPQERRTGWIVDPQPIEYTLKTQKNWFMPCSEDLAGLAARYSNAAIAAACGVSDQTVRHWLQRAGISRDKPITEYGKQVPDKLVRRLKSRAVRKDVQVHAHTGRLTPDRVSRIISDIGEEAGIVVKTSRPGEQERTKYASAHDLRRGGAQRLINAGVSAETLKVVMRHRDFATTERFYGATRKAQSAAAEIHEKLGSECRKTELVGRLVGRSQEVPEFSAAELLKLKRLLNSL